MKKRFNKYFPPLFVFGELVVLSIVFLGTHLVTFGTLEIDNSYGLPFVFGICAWSVLSAINKDYKIGRAVSYYYTFKQAFYSVFVFVSIISILWLSLEIPAITRSFLTTLFLFVLIWITIYRVFVHIALDKYRAFGGNIRNAMILGYDRLGFNLYDTLMAKPHYGIRCKGFYDNNVDFDANYPLNGKLDDLFGEVHEDIDVIYVTEYVDKNLLKEVTKRADDLLIKVKLLPDFGSVISKTFILQRFGDIPVVDVNNLPLDNVFNRLVKRSFDIVFSFTIIVLILSWLYPLLGLLIKLESKGPVLFKQKRHGKDGSEFWCYKFRTMILNDEADSRWASQNDPRVTKVGLFLRRTSLDEFPQFINVFIGSMSIVGPRPHPINLNMQYKSRVEKFAKRHTSKPGVTGLAQAMGYRGEIDDYYQMSSRVRLDRFYLQNWTFILDIKIIFLTIVSIIRGMDKAY